MRVLQGCSAYLGVALTLRPLAVLGDILVAMTLGWRAPRIYGQRPGLLQNNPDVQGGPTQVVGPRYQCRGSETMLKPGQGE